MLRYILIVVFFLNSACSNTLTHYSERNKTTPPNPAVSCGLVGTDDIKKIVNTPAKWTIPVRKPGPITSFDDMRGVVIPFPVRVDKNGTATMHRMILESIQYVQIASGELAVAAIRGQRDDGKIINAKNLAEGRQINTPQDLIGTKILDRSMTESGLLTIQSIGFSSRDDGLLLISHYRLLDEAGRYYNFTGELNNLFSCSKTFVNVCACPKFLGYCDDDNYPNCATESCNFGNATCAAKVEISCPGFCVLNGNPGICVQVPLTQKCGCFAPKLPEE